MPSVLARIMPDSFYATKLEVTPLDRNRKMMTFFVTGISLALMVFGFLTWFFVTQDTTIETRVLTEPKPESEKEWTCTMLSLLPPQPTQYSCFDTAYDRTADGKAALELWQPYDPETRVYVNPDLETKKLPKCAETGDENVFRAQIYNKEDAVAKLGDTAATFVPKDKGSGYIKNANSIKITHVYELFETHKQCLDNYKCMAPTKKDTTLHTDEDGKVRGCLVTGLGETSADIDKAIYLPFDAAETTDAAAAAAPATGGRGRKSRQRRRRRGLSGCRDACFVEGPSSVDECLQACVQQEQQRRQQQRGRRDGADGSNDDDYFDDRAFNYDDDTRFMKTDVYPLFKGADDDLTTQLGIEFWTDDYDLGDDDYYLDDDDIFGGDDDYDDDDNDGPGQASECYCQFGDDMTIDPDEKMYESCLLSEVDPSTGACTWVYNSANYENEIDVSSSEITSYGACITAVQEQCPTATVANFYFSAPPLSKEEIRLQQLDGCLKACDKPSPTFYQLLDATYKYRYDRTSKFWVDDGDDDYEYDDLYAALVAEKEFAKIAHFDALAKDPLQFSADSNGVAPGATGWAPSAAQKKECGVHCFQTTQEEFTEAKYTSFTTGDGLADAISAQAAAAAVAAALESASNECVEKWNELYCDPVKSQATIEYFKHQYCKPFIFKAKVEQSRTLPATDGGSTTETRKGASNPGNPPYACTREQRMAVATAISLALSYAQYFYALCLWAICRTLWKTFRSTEEGAKAQREYDSKMEAAEKRAVKRTKSTTENFAGFEETAVGKV